MTYLRISSPWLKKKLDFDDLKCQRIRDLNRLSQDIFTMFEENLDFDYLKCPRMKDLNRLSQCILTMIKEHF